MGAMAMRAFRAFRLAIALSCAFAGAAYAGALDNIYDDQELADLQPRYERGWRIIMTMPLCRLTAEERAVRKRSNSFRPRARSRAIGFIPGDQVVASTASLKFRSNVAEPELI